MTDYPRALPHDLHAERAVLGSVLLEPDAIAHVADTLTGASFHLPNHGYVFDAAAALYTRREPIDVTTVAAELRRRDWLDLVGGMTFLVKLTNDVADPYRVAHYGRIVDEAAVRRRLIEVGGVVSATGWDESRPLPETLDAAEAALLGVTRHTNSGGFIGIAQAVQERAAQYQRVIDGEEETPGVRTGLIDLDRVLGSFKPGQLIIIGARPSVGKSALLQTLARNIARDGGHVALTSLEMGRDEIIDRFAAMEVGLNLDDIRNYRVAGSALARFYTALANVEQWPASIDDEPGQSISAIRARARALHNRTPLACLFIDYLQLIAYGANERSENDALTTISKGLKALARELKVPIVALAQLNRETEKRASHVPTLADFRGSGSLEQDADVVIFPYREELYSPDTDKRGIAELHVTKHRNGPKGVATVRFDEPTAQFLDLRRYQEVPGYDLAAD